MKVDLIFAFVKELCRYAGEDETFAETFWKKLQADEEILEEFSYYMEHGNFACRAKVAGYTAVDVMVWQMDHFKAQMDRGKDDMKNNGDKMLLMAFDSLLRMEQNPDYYVNLIQTETGTDYPGKYN